MLMSVRSMHSHTRIAMGCYTSSRPSTHYSTFMNSYRRGCHVCLASFTPWFPLQVVVTACLRFTPCAVSGAYRYQHHGECGTAPTCLPFQVLPPQTCFLALGPPVLTNFVLSFRVQKHYIHLQHSCPPHHLHIRSTSPVSPPTHF